MQANAQAEKLDAIAATVVRIAKTAGIQGVTRH
jgi:hypothetical protein